MVGSSARAMVFEALCSVAVALGVGVGGSSIVVAGAVGSFVGGAVGSTTAAWVAVTLGNGLGVGMIGVALGVIGIAFGVLVVVALACGVVVGVGVASTASRVISGVSVGSGTLVGLRVGVGTVGVAVAVGMAVGGMPVQISLKRKSGGVLRCSALESVHSQPSTSPGCTVTLPAPSCEYCHTPSTIRE